MNNTLYKAVYGNNIAKVIALLKQGADPNFVYKTKILQGQIYGKPVYQNNEIPVLMKAFDTGNII